MIYIFETELKTTTIARISLTYILGITIAIPYIFMNCKIIWVFFVNEKVTITDLDFSTILTFQSRTQDYYLVTITCWE